MKMRRKKRAKKVKEMEKMRKKMKRKRKKKRKACLKTKLVILHLETDTLCTERISIINSMKLSSTLS